MKKAYNIIALCLTGLQRAVRAALACVGINCFKAAEHSCDSRKIIIGQFEWNEGKVVFTENKNGNFTLICTY